MNKEQLLNEIENFTANAIKELLEGEHPELIISSYNVSLFKLLFLNEEKIKTDKHIFIEKLLKYIEEEVVQVNPVVEEIPYFLKKIECFSLKELK